jgi:hypothetical protein
VIISDHFRPHNPRGRGRAYEAELTRPLKPLRPLALRPLGKSGENFEFVSTGATFEPTHDHFRPHLPASILTSQGDWVYKATEAKSTRPVESTRPSSQGRCREAESTRPTTKPLDRVYGATEKIGESFNFEFSMSTNLKWLASTGSAAQILNLTLNCDHFRPHDPQGQGRQ